MNNAVIVYTKYINILLNFEIRKFNVKISFIIYLVIITQNNINLALEVHFTYIQILITVSFTFYYP